MKKIVFTIILFPFIGFSQIFNQTMFFDGLNREYIVYLPSNYDGVTNFPVLFNFHGGSGYANDFMLMVEMNNIADTAGFIAVYPQAALDIDGTPGSIPPTSWLHKAPTTHNDVNFVSALIDTLKINYNIDSTRIYACGYSEGGIFSYELACRLNNKIAAIVSVSGSMLTESFRTDYGFGSCSPSHPTAVMLIPGTDDDSYHAMYSGFAPYYLSVNEITNYWSNYNNTDQNPIVTSLPNFNTSDGSSIERKEWINGTNCVSVVELKVDSGGHDWPGHSFLGNMDISASAEIWNFVSKFNIDGLIDCNSTSNYEINSKNDRRIISVSDIFGRQTSKDLNNHLLFYLFDDGSVEKRIILE